VVTPSGEVSTVSGGVYRFDIDAHGHAGLKVTKGCAAIGGQYLRHGRTATVGGGPAQPGSFDPHDADAFDNWSRERAAALIDSNKSLKNTDWHKTLAKKWWSFFEINYDERHRMFKAGHIVSALGGFVSFVENGVEYQSGESGWAPLNQGDDLTYGHHIRTGPDSRAEINVYPTCELFLSSNSEAVYGARPDGNTELRLLRGSAILIYLVGPKDVATPVTLAAPQVEYEIAGAGVYRLNLTPNGSEMVVRSGKIKVPGHTVGDGKKVTSRDGAAAITSIGRVPIDSFDVWSRNRLGFDNHRVELYGIWYFDQTAGAYTFVSGRYSFNSPYGGKYSVGFDGRGR
jgi:hypothetical protein